MKKVILIIYLLPVQAWCQYHFDFENDSSSDQEICSSILAEQIPGNRWECSQENPISGNASLHHSFDNPLEGCDYFLLKLDPLSEPDSLTFSFRIRHGYSPSSSNNWQLAILASHSVLSSSEDNDPPELEIMDGLILGVNFNGPDDLLNVWLCEQGECSILCTTNVNYQEEAGIDAAPEIRLEWNREEGLKLYFTSDPTGAPGHPVQPKQLIGSCELENLPAGRELLVRYKYTSSQDRKLWIDELQLEGNFVKDTTPPVIMGLMIQDATHVQIKFSEFLLRSQFSSFIIYGDDNEAMEPGMVYWNGDQLLLEFPREIPNRENQQLRISNVCDTDANCLRDTTLFCFRNEAEWGDVVINELMADPSPAVLLPEKEYIEFFNRSAYELDLKGWRIEVNNKPTVLSSQGFDFRTGMEDLLVLKQLEYGVISGITLPNDGATVAIYNEFGRLIHAVGFAIPWEGPSWKAEGGWSLEWPDTELLCGTSEMWEYSTDLKGGTPGGDNSNRTDLADSEPPLFLYAGYGPEPGSVCLHYSEQVKFSSGDLPMVRLLPGNIQADSVTRNMPPGDQLICWFSDHPGFFNEFRLKFPGVEDCSGNHSPDLLLKSGRVTAPVQGDVVINEIMYHPEDGKPEYIELYAPGKVYLDLRDLAMEVSLKDESPQSPVPLSDHSRIIPPGSFLVVTKNSRKFMDAYHLELNGQWVEVSALGALNNSEGTVYLTDRNGEILDMAVYGDRLQLDIIDNNQGVSLERISSEVTGTNPDNWHSAASIEGYATPGGPNSQKAGTIEEPDLVEVDPDLFSPDNDGFQDMLNIFIHPGTQGWIVNLILTDLRGNMIRQLANNHLIGPSVTYTWDGERNDGSMVTEGIYIILVSGYLPRTGEQWQRRKAIGVVYR